MSFSEEFGKLDPQELLKGVESVLAEFEVEGAEERLTQDSAIPVAMCYVLARAVEFLLLKALPGED
jgi:hypothetical protein